MSDWRDTKGYYPTEVPCVICGSTDNIGSEPRFGYSVCEEHSKLSPVEISKMRKDYERS
jgi:recombinational DNA repair protein (RecF pathway)